MRILAHTFRVMATDSKRKPSDFRELSGRKRQLIVLDNRGILKEIAGRAKRVHSIVSRTFHGEFKKPDPVVVVCINDVLRERGILNSFKEGAR